MQKWGVGYRETYAQVVNWISVRSPLAIASIHEFPSMTIDFVLAFPKYYLGMDVFIYITLGIVVDLNRGEFVIKLNKSLYGLNKLSDNWFDPLSNGL